MSANALFVFPTSTLIRFRSVFVLFSVHKGLENNGLIIPEHATKTDERLGKAWRSGMLVGFSNNEKIIEHSGHWIAHYCYAKFMHCGFMFSG